MPSLPMPLRAALGLVATVMDEARHLPDRAIELPMLAVSSALQVSLRAQQRYARLAARGDELLAGRAPEEPPEWAHFDEPVPDATPGSHSNGTRRSSSRTPDTPRTPGTPRTPRAGKQSPFDIVGDD